MSVLSVTSVLSAPLRAGDLLGLSIDNMDSLTPMPVGCGEQNLIHFTPSVYVLDYLEMMDVNKDGIRQKAMERLMEGETFLLSCLLLFILFLFLN